MIKYAKVINETGLCEVGVGTDYTYYKKMGLIELDVQKSDIDGQWYLSEKCPMKSEEERIKDLVENKKSLSYKGWLYQKLLRVIKIT